MFESDTRAKTLYETAGSAPLMRKEVSTEGIYMDPWFSPWIMPVVRSEYLDYLDSRGQKPGNSSRDTKYSRNIKKNSQRRMGRNEIVGIGAVNA